MQSKKVNNSQIDAFDDAWAKLASIPGNQVKCSICFSPGKVTLSCERKAWYGLNERQCKAFLQGN